jgi:acyl-CoA reductase-like NAD-dependent aldehyde dehydrogenase
MGPRASRLLSFRLTLLVDGRTVAARLLANLSRPGFTAAHIGAASRAATLMAAHDLLLRRAESLAELAFDSLGTPPFETHTAEVLTLLESFRHAARVSRDLFAPEPVKGRVAPVKRIFTERVPHGVVVVISPWNFPLAIPGTEIAHALLAGNSVVWKPSEHALPLSRALHEIFLDAGVPRETLLLVEGGPEKATALLDDDVDYVSFTGSTTTGREVAARAAARGIPCRVELGGKGDAIVCDDAHLERTALALAYGAFFHAGQVCAGVQRAYVARDLVLPLVERLERELHDSVFPSKRAPLVLPGARAVLDAFVDDARAKGARIVGAAERGAVVLVAERADLRARHEECFGPLLVVVPVDDDEAALAALTAAPGDLMLSIFSEDGERARALAARAPASVVMVNDVIWSYGIPELSFGGARKSGFPATHGQEGIRGYTRPRVVVDERFRPLVREPTWFPYTESRLALVKRATHVLYASVDAMKEGARARVKSLLGRE